MWSRDGRGRAEDHVPDAVTPQSRDVGMLAGPVPLRVAEDDLVAVRHRRALDVHGEGSPERVGYGGHDEGDRPGVAGAELAGGPVGAVLEARDRAIYPTARRGSHAAGASVQHVGHRAHGHPGEPGDVSDRCGVGQTGSPCPSARAPLVSSPAPDGMGTGRSCRGGGVSFYVVEGYTSPRSIVNV